MDKNATTYKTIGLFNDSFPPIMDGVSTVVKNYAYWLHKKKQKTCVVSPASPGYIDDEPYPVYRYSSLPLYSRKPYRLGVPQFNFSLKSFLDKTPFELLHAHCPFSSAGLALHLAKYQNIPLIATFHSKYKNDFENTLHNKALTKLIIQRIIRFYEKADEVWIPQPAVEETIREYGYKGKLEVVDNGSDYVVSEPIRPLKRKARQTLGIPDCFPVFLFVGQHIREKNVFLIIESLAKIIDIPFKMFFIGTGYARKEMKEMVKFLRLDKQVEFLGTINDREKLKQYYAAADLFLFPSLYDNAPLVMREAAALHTPAVLLKGSTAAEIVQDGVNGFLTTNSVQAYADKIREIIGKPFLIEEAGQNASMTIVRSWEDITNEVLDRYSKLVLRKSGNVAYKFSFV